MRNAICSDCTEPQASRTEGSEWVMMMQAYTNTCVNHDQD
jgi:hypothetical protein